MNKFFARYSPLLLVFPFILAACDQSDVPTNGMADDGSLLVERQAGDVIPGKYIVVLKDSELATGKTSREVLDEMTSADGVDEEFRYGSALNGFSGSFTPEAIERLRSNPLVDYVEKDRVVSLPPFSTLGRCDKNPNKPGCPGDGGGDEPAPDPTETQSTPWGIARVNGGSSGVGKTVCVLDTGVDLDHRDLNVSAGLSQSFLGGRDANNPDDQNGHGTHVAGTIGAINNSVDVVGVAAGATIVSLRVLDRRGSGSYSGVIAGVDYVAENPGLCDVANMSLGGGVSTTLDGAVIAASSVTPFVLAAGNESDDADNHSPARACLNQANVYTISAMDINGNWAYFSNYGTAVDFAAPGVGIESLWKNGGTNTISGTSMAAPHVAGILLLGSVKSNGTVSGDPDGSPDPIASH